MICTQEAQRETDSERRNNCSLKFVCGYSRLNFQHKGFNIEKTSLECERGEEKTMNQAVGHGPPTRQLVRMDLLNGMLTVCPRCAHPGHLILGLLKTRPVCIDCAVDPTWTNPQQNWPEDGVKVSGGGVFKGEIGPCRIIVQHPKYSVLEQVFGRRDVLMVYNTGAYKLPRRSGNTLNNHVANFKMPIATTQAEKSNMQYLGQFNATNITQGETELAMKGKKTNLSHNTHVHPINKTFLASKPQTMNLLNSKEDFTVSENHAKLLESFVDKSCLAQVQKHPVSKVTNPRMLNDRMNLCDAYERNCRYDQGVEAMVRNVQTTTVPGFVEQAKPPMHGNTYMVSQQANGIQNVHKIPNMCCALENPTLQNCRDVRSDCCGHAYETNWTFTQDASRIRSEAVPLNAQHASLTKAGNLVQHVRLPGVTDCPYKVTIQENMHHPAFDKLHEDELSNWHQNNILSYEFDQCNTFPPTFTTSAEHVTPPSAKKWPYKVATHHIIPSDAETRSEFHYDLPNQKAFPCSILPEADEQTIGRIAAQKNQMPAKTLPNQNMNESHSNSIYRNELVNPRQLPQQATSVEQVQSPTEAMDLYKMATKENQMEAAKLSNQEVDILILYPCSIFSSNLTDHKSPTTATEQGKSTEDVIIVDSETSTTEECSQIEPMEFGNQQTQSSCYPYSVFNLVDPKTLATTTEQRKPTVDVTAMASNSVTTENWALIEFEKLCNQQVLSSWNIYDVANSESNPVSTEHVTPKEDVVEMAFMMATQENGAQIQREISSDQDVSIMQAPSNPSNQPNKPDALPKTAPFPGNANSPQKATDLIKQTASEDENPHIEEGSKSTNTETKTSVGKLHEFDTIEDLMNAIKTGKFSSHNNVLSNKPNQQKTTESTKEKDTEKEDTESGPCIVHQYPKVSDVEFTFPDKTNEIVEAESPQKLKSGTTTLAVDQQNCTDVRVNLKEQVTYQSEEDKNTNRLKSAIEIERQKLRTQRAIIKQLKKLVTRPKCDVECAEDVTDNEHREKQTDISDLTHPRRKDMRLEHADCPNKESTILNTSNSNDYKLCETQRETIMPPEIKRTLKMELNVGSKRLRDEGMVLTMPHIEEKKPNQEQKEQLDTMNIGTDELHDFESSRLARAQTIKTIHSGPVEENAMTIQKVESLMTRKSGTVLLEIDFKCGANEGKLSTKNNPQTEYIEDQKLPQDDTDPMIISKELKVEMLDMVPCQKEDLKQANKTLITPQHESFQASKPVYVYENPPTADQLEKTKASEVVLRNEKSLGSTEPLLVAQELGGNLGRKGDYNETHSSGSSKDDKTRFENQEFEIAAKKPKFEEHESKCCKKEISEAQAAVQPLERKGTASTNCPEDVTKLAKKATNVEKPIKRVEQTNIAKPESHSKKERKEEQINHTASGYVALQQNKAKTQMHKNQEKGNTFDSKTCKTMLHKTKKTPCLYKEVKSQEPVSDEATNLAKARSVERQQDTSPSIYKEGETLKQQITVPIQKVKSQKPISDEATNLAKARSLGTQRNTSPSKRHKEEETPKHQITVQNQKVKSQITISDEATNLAKARSLGTQRNISPSKNHKEEETPKHQITVQNNKKGPRTQIKESRSECSNENGHCKTHETTETPHNPNRPSTSDCGLLRNAAHNMKRFAAIPQGENKQTHHPSKEVALTNSDYTASRTSVDKSIKDENVQSEKPCTSTAQVRLNENKTEMPRLQERKIEITSDNDQGKTHGTIQPQGKPQDSERISTSDSIMSRTRVASERERCPDQKSIRYCVQNQHGINAVDHREGDRTPPPTITQNPNYHYLQKEWNPKPYPDFNTMSQRGTFSSNIPQDSKGLGDEETEISVDNGFGKAQRTRQYPASERLFFPDRAMPRNPVYVKEMHSRHQSHLQYSMSKEHWVQHQDYESDARNIINNLKALRTRLPSETHEDREFASPYPRGLDKHRDYEQRTKDPRILPRMERERQNTGTNMLLASMSSVQEPLEKGEVKEEPVLLDIQMHVFDKKSRRIELNPREESLDKWSKIVIKTVRSKGQRTDVNKAINVNWVRMTNILTGCANPHLIFRERKPRNGIITKFTHLMRVTYWNNTLEISIYAHAFGLWLCATQRNDAANLQRRKYFFANAEQGSAEKVTRQDDDAEFERRNEGESYEAVKSHEMANKERHRDLPQRYTGQYSNEADEFARSGREHQEHQEHQDRKRTKYTKPHVQERGFRRERDHPTRHDGSRDNFSRDRGDYGQRQRLDSM